jgi:hypothetical protein
MLMPVTDKERKSEYCYLLLPDWEPQTKKYVIRPAACPYGNSAN